MPEPLLSERLIGSTLFLSFRGLDFGVRHIFVAASQRPELIGAVVSRGGRLELAGGALRLVRAPTLLIVGGADGLVIEMNREALAQLDAPKQLEIISGATHLFEEPGTLERVAQLAREWFMQHLSRVKA